MGLLAGATLGVGPAQAAPPTGQAAPSSTAGPQQNRDHDGEIVGYYRNYWKCDRAGRFGERHGAWDDYFCARTRWGYHRGHWALVVDDRYWNDDWGSGNWPNNWPNRPHWNGGGYWHGGGYGDGDHGNGGGYGNGGGHGDGGGHGNGGGYGNGGGGGGGYK
ncbi:hypothetical protein ACFQFC_10870 [Amorphoplanes digitatis]|uniref:hypothetical protein n=1 Tax=Actinoplanes digitatis TaxID=1868 RepID=UPI001940CC24|nr:hypothetical protein [Actinoplanes digitatis]